MPSSAHPRGSAGRPASGESTVPALTVAAVARRLGVAPATLRTWDRRYRLGPSAHLAGSLVCALAPSMIVLVLGRALQGIGGAGLSSICLVVLGDVAAPKDRGRYYTYFSMTYTTAGACGPNSASSSDRSGRSAAAAARCGART